MKESNQNIIVVPTKIKNRIQEICSSFKLSKLEEMVSSNQIKELPIFYSKSWFDFSVDVQQVFKDSNFVVIQGLSSDYEGSELIFATLTVGESLRTYRNGKVTKHFKMSPWTKELAHTTYAGEFHTDLNTETHPPEITAIQCLDPDPGSPHFGILYIASISNLLKSLKNSNSQKALHFLMEKNVTMLSERSSSSWSGRLVKEGKVRYHPETLRSAVKRFDISIPNLESIICKIEKFALSVSTPLDLHRGDIVLVSNTKALHRRGESSVIFKKFPTEFESRKIAILHANQEWKLI